MTACQIIVEDNGGGVEPDDLKKLGQRFYRPAGQNEKRQRLRAFDCNAHCRIAQIESAVGKCDGTKSKNWIKSDHYFIS